MLPYLKPGQLLKTGSWTWKDTEFHLAFRSGVEDPHLLFEEMIGSFCRAENSSWWHGGEPGSKGLSFPRTKVGKCIINGSFHHKNMTCNTLPG